MPGYRFTHCFFTDDIMAPAEWRTSLSQPEMFAALRDGAARYDNVRDRAALKEKVIHATHLR